MQQQKRLDPVKLLHSNVHCMRVTGNAAPEEMSDHRGTQTNTRPTLGPLNLLQSQTTLGEDPKLRLHILVPADAATRRVLESACG